MEFQSYHNTLMNLKNMGFAVTWSLIKDGLNYNEELVLNFSYEEIFDFLKAILGQTKAHEDEIIQIICCEDDIISVRNKLYDFSRRESEDLNLNLRKWRALLLQEKISNTNTTLVDLYVFWLTFVTINPAPLFYPINPVVFLSQEESQAIEKHKEWLKDEVESIIFHDKKINASYGI